jgi:L,D-transpeptidase YcbB
MPGRRVALFVASTAIVLLSATARNALAEPLVGEYIDTTILAPASSAAPAKNATEPNVQPAIPAPEESNATPPAASTPGSGDGLIAEQLRNLANGKFDRIIGDNLNRTKIDAFYSGRNYAPLWIIDGKPNSRAKAAIAYLGQVDADGLDPADYPVPDFAALTDPATLAEAEIRLTTSVITYAHHAQVGRVHWTRVSGDIFYDQMIPEPADVLATMVSATDLGEALAAYEPQNPTYLALKAELAELRADKGNAGETPVADGPPLKVGAQDARVSQLRERLSVVGGTIYDKTLADVVKKFQQHHGLKATGTLTSATIETLNGRQPDRTEDIIIANMERWRWMPHDLGKTYVIVNLPDFTLRVIQDGKQVWMTRIVDGKPATPTPITSAEMKSITVNPTWNIPDSIAANEYVPLLRQDSTILARMGLEVSRNPNGTIHISQPSGPNSALGQLRFNFPNRFLVYQHDSNEKYLFANPIRDNSHGCMRVENPVKYAEVLLALVRPGEGYTQERIHRMFGNTEVEIHLPTFIPVHLTYQTAFVDEQGKLQFREHIYGRDKALLTILKGDERKVADIPIERRDNAIRREALAMPDQAWGWGGQNFFARLFGFPFAVQPSSIPPRRVGVHQRPAVSDRTRD